MAFISIEQSRRSRLASTKGVTVIADPSPRNPSVVAMIIAGVRCIDIRQDGDAYRAALHVRAGEWLTLAEGVEEEVAFAAVVHFLALVASVPQHYAPEHDAAERAAAAEVLAAFTPALSLAA